MAAGSSDEGLQLALAVLESAEARAAGPTGQHVSRGTLPRLDDGDG
jgi:hypothetical protein